MARDIPLNRYRTIGVLAAEDAGKTTLVERLLQATRPAAEGTHGASLASPATVCAWRGHQLTFIDTHGAWASTEEVSRILSVVDGVVIVIDAEAGIEDETVRAWALADAAQLPRLVFVNKLDRAGADFAGVLDQVAARFGVRPLAVALPVGQGAGFAGLYDLVHERVVHWTAAGETHDPEVPSELMRDAAQRRKALIQAAVTQADDAAQALEKGVRPDEARLVELVRAGVIARAFVPVVPGSAFRNQGVDSLLDAMVDYLPAPTDLPALRGRAPEGALVERRADDAEPLAALAFTTMVDPVMGPLTFVRLFSGSVASGTQALNSSRGTTEEIRRVLRMHADRREALTEARAGDVVALQGLEATTTGDTLADPAQPIVIERPIAA
ncbi:GTP-binding protein [Zavarzinia sp. CC-PAN008]|uniref:GTP-binding protein n=1 Tax=Zavarzinia sp. CC-PAN008 TaxID=3243332 RepID=UPI003F742C8A